MEWTLTSDHSSLQSDQWLETYISDRVKYYYLPLHTKGLVNPKLALQMGCYNPAARSHQEVLRSLIKAQKAHYSHVKILFDRVGDSLTEHTLLLAKQMEIPVVLQVFTSFLCDDNFFASLEKVQGQYDFEWVLDDNSELITKRILKIQHLGSQGHLTVPINKNVNWQRLYCAPLFSAYRAIHLYFPYKLSSKDGNFTCKQAHRLVGLLRQNFPGLVFLPPKGVDLWDLRARHDFDMEPYILPCYETHSLNPQVKFSVIIPTFNNQNHLRGVLRHLYKQNVGLDSFEVIVVDDGGTDQTQALVIQLLRSFSKPMNFKYIFFPRARKRQMGDSQYRAGISRNLGAKNAAGDIFCFLDSDIIVPEDYLKKVEVGLQKWDGLQAKRINLSRSASSLDIEYKSVNKKTDTIADEPYWEKFIQTKNWHKVPYNWKYVCTHSFSISKELFWKLGGLKKNFIFYGFEDTDLGYRLVKRGYRLHLLDVEVYHMFHEDSRSEFLNLKSMRHSLLSRTAQVFYLHHLDSDIFSNLIGFMEPEPSFQESARNLLRAVSFNFVWGKRSQVYRSIRRTQTTADLK
jgi:glycosyltransferase involved in cell wall biosynthesis